MTATFINTFTHVCNVGYRYSGLLRRAKSDNYGYHRLMMGGAIAVLAS